MQKLDDLKLPIIVLIIHNGFIKALNEDGGLSYDMLQPIVLSIFNQSFEFSSHVSR